MNVYILTMNKPDWDAIRGLAIVAENEQRAREISAAYLTSDKNEYKIWEDEDGGNDVYDSHVEWANGWLDPKTVECELAIIDKEGVIMK